MADMEVDTPTGSKSRKEPKEDGKESKKRFEVKKVSIYPNAYLNLQTLMAVGHEVECGLTVGMGYVLVIAPCTER